MPKLKNCWACDISSGSRTFKGGGATKSAEGASFLGGLGACPAQKFLKMWVSKMTISSILRQISHLFNTTHNALLVNFFSVKKKKKKSKIGGEGGQKQV